MKTKIFEDKLFHQVIRVKHCGNNELIYIHVCMHVNLYAILYNYQVILAHWKCQRFLVDEEK